MRRRGFTMAEVAIAVLFVGLIVGIAMALLRYAAVGFDRSGARVSPRQAGLLAMTRLRDVLCDASEVDADGEAATVVVPGEEGKPPDRARIAFDRRRGEVVLERAGRPPERLAGPVAAFRIWTEPGRPELVFLSVAIERPATVGLAPLPPVVVHHEVRLAMRDRSGYL